VQDRYSFEARGAVPADRPRVLERANLGIGVTRPTPLERRLPFAHGDSEAATPADASASSEAAVVG
jgi:hypothetical protein